MFGNLTTVILEQTAGTATFSIENLTTIMALPTFRHMAVSDLRAQHVDGIQYSIVP